MSESAEMRYYAVSMFPDANGAHYDDRCYLHRLAHPSDPFPVPQGHAYCDNFVRAIEDSADRLLRFYKRAEQYPNGAHRYYCWSEIKHLFEKVE